MSKKEFIIDYSEEFERRIENRFPFKEVRKIIADKKIIIAGGAFLKENPTDFDIYPDTIKDGFDYLEKPAGLLLSQTANAKTFKNKVVMQFCSYRKDSLEELVESFDFAHCQIGARINLENEQIADVYYTHDFVKALVLEKTTFTGSDYPLSSLIRINKYIRKGRFAGKSWIWDVIMILVDIINRGFHDYEDFKDQLDAVDLGLLPEDFENMGNGGPLVQLFEILRRDKHN